MRHLLLTVSIFAAVGPTPSAAEACLGGGVPRLNEVAHRLNVRPVEPSRSALNACDGRAYEIGALLGAAITRIERSEAAIKKLEGTNGKR